MFRQPLRRARPGSRPETQGRGETIYSKTLSAPRETTSDVVALGKT